MISLELLQNSLKNPASQSPSEDPSSQENFNKIVNLIEQEKINEAARLIEKSFAKGIPDIRLIVYYYYSHFFNHGIKSFIEIFPNITTLVQEHWETLQPHTSKEKQVQSSLNWFFSHVINKLKYCEKLYKDGRTHPVWEKSINEISKEELNKLGPISADFKNFFMEKWPKSPIKERVLHLIKKIDDMASLALNESNKLDEEEKEEINVPLEPEHEPVETTTTPEEIPEDTVDVSQTEEATFSEEPLQIALAEEPSETISAAKNAEDPSLISQEQLPASNLFQEGFSLEKMEVFFQKLKVFELLISKNDYVKAALVAKDIDHQIENFDILEYFPKLFSNYFSLLAKNVAALSQQWDNKEALQLKFLEKLYRTDLDKFLNW